MLKIFKFFFNKRITLGFIAFIPLPISVISCADYEFLRKDPVQKSTSNNNVVKWELITFNDKIKPRKKNDLELLPLLKYNALVEKMRNQNTLALSVIFNEKAYVFEMKHQEGLSVWGYMQQFSQIGFKYSDVPQLGIWIGPFYKKSNPTTLIHGRTNSTNYGMKGYPLFIYNDEFGNLGASNYRPVKRQIIEITYNHGS